MLFRFSLSGLCYFLFLNTALKRRFKILRMLTKNPFKKISPLSMINIKSMSTTGWALRGLGRKKHQKTFAKIFFLQMFIFKICGRHGQMRKEKRYFRKIFKSLENFRVFSQQPKTKINMERNFVKFRQHRRKWKRNFWFNPSRCPAPGILEHIWDFIGTWLEWTTLTL